jgi:hypothetical protein
VERRLATCLDSTLLFAACLEQAHLNPVLVLTNGHAFVTDRISQSGRVHGSILIGWAA